MSKSGRDCCVGLSGSGCDDTTVTTDCANYDRIGSAIVNSIANTCEHNAGGQDCGVSDTTCTTTCSGSGCCDCSTLPGTVTDCGIYRDTTYSKSPPYTDVTVSKSVATTSSCTPACSGSGCCDITTLACTKSNACKHMYIDDPVNEYYCYYDGTNAYIKKGIGAPAEFCGDGADNDCDGCTDTDYECGGVENVCGDGKDNDCDGSIDMADPDCSTAVIDNTWRCSSPGIGGYGASGLVKNCVFCGCPSGGICNTNNPAYCNVSVSPTCTSHTETQCPCGFVTKGAEVNKPSLPLSEEVVSFDKWSSQFDATCCDVEVWTCSCPTGSTQTSPQCELGDCTCIGQADATECQVNGGLCCKGGYNNIGVQCTDCSTSGGSCNCGCTGLVGCSCGCGGYGVLETNANNNCLDGRDNDCDGLTDCCDPACTTCTEVCNDAADNDCDTCVDKYDSNCAGAGIEGKEIYACNGKTGAEYASCVFDYCHNSLDDDCDTLTDCNDVDCQTWRTGGKEDDCNDAADNDCDTLTDCNDIDCTPLNYNAPVQDWMLSNPEWRCTTGNGTDYNTLGYFLCQGACADKAVNCVCDKNNCGAQCDKNNPCLSFDCNVAYSGCYNPAGNKGCSAGDATCVYRHYYYVSGNDMAPGHCLDDCTCVNDPCQYDAETADSGGRIGWTDQCDGLYISTPVQSMNYLELWPSEKVFIGGKISLNEDPIITSCDQPWVIDEIWNKSISGNTRVGCDPGPRGSQSYKFSTVLNKGDTDYYGIYWTRAGNMVCDYSAGNFSHLTFMGCDQSQMFYSDDRAVAQKGLGDPLLDGTYFDVLTPSFYFNDIEITDVLVNEQRTTSPEDMWFEINLKTNDMLGIISNIQTSCFLGYNFTMLMPLKESPDTDAESDLLSDITDCNTATDWDAAFGTQSQIEPWDHLILFYAPEATTYYLDIDQANDFVSDMYLDNMLVPTSWVMACNEAPCYCEHFTEGCGKATTFRTIKFNLGYLSQGFHTLKFKVVDVCSSGYANGITITNLRGDVAQTPKWSCSKWDKNFKCDMAKGDMEIFDFCKRPQRVGCISYANDPNNDGKTVPDNALFNWVDYPFNDCPQYCSCEPESKYYLNIETGYCESKCSCSQLASGKTVCPGQCAG